MQKSNIYRATNRVTGEKKEGTAKDLAEIIGCTRNTINRIATDGRSAYNWEVVLIQKAEKKSELTKERNITKSILQEWDAVVGMFKGEKNYVGGDNE